VTKLWQVAWQEYRRRVFNRRFIFIGLLSVPLLILVLGGLIWMVISLDSDTTPLGYVDHSGLLTNPVPGPSVKGPYQQVPIIPFEDEDQASKALAAGSIQAYYVLPSDYLQEGDISLYHIDSMKTPVRSQFYSFLAANLMKNTDPATARRLAEGSDVVVQSPDGSRSVSGSNWFNTIIPMVIGIAFIIAMFTSGGYLLNSLVEEKENRTMEVIITSVSPNQFMAGKIIGDTLVGLTQIILWSLCILAPVLLFRDAFSFLKSIQVGSMTVIIVLAVVFPSFVTVAALMATIGATVAEAREGQQMVSLLAMPVWIPYMLTSLLLFQPNSTIGIILSLLPLTAPITLLMREGLTILPVWQVIISSCIQVVAAVAAIWMAGKAFRLGMLRYGKRLRIRAIFTRGRQP
jgi:ABC-2 type transport system permease protein